MSEVKKPREWTIEYNENGSYDVTDYPEYCTDEEYVGDELTLVEKSAFDKAVEALKNICKEQSIPDFEVNVKHAREVVLKELGVEV